MTARCIGTLLLAAACSVKTSVPAPGGIGPAGGVLMTGGVTIDIPPGALDSERALTLSVAPGPVIEVLPSTEFLAPVRVTLDPSLWPGTEPAFAQFAADGEWYLIDDLAEDARGAFYETTGFSQQRVDHYLDAPGTGPWLLHERFPARAERDSSGADPSSLAAVRGCLHVVPGFAHDPITARPGRTDDEAYSMTPEAETALRKLEQLVGMQLGSDRHVYLNGAYDSSGAVHHGAKSLHYGGMALDLTVCRTPCSAAEKDPTLLGALAPLAVSAGFTWVFFEDGHHIHASVRSPSLAQCLASIADAGPRDAPFTGMLDAAIADARMDAFAVDARPTASDARPPDASATLDAGRPDAAPPCGGVEGTWTTSCPDTPGCADCPTIFAYDDTFTIAAGTASAGGTWVAGERQYEWNPATCHLTVSLLGCLCCPLPSEWQLSGATGTHLGSTYGCWSLDTNQCECTGPRPAGQCTIQRF
jgi:hypothetical protein